MKASFAIIISCLLFSISNIALAGCGGSYGCGSNSCNEDESSCNCTDPTCNLPYNSDCIDKSTCCRAFGNVGGLR